MTVMTVPDFRLPTPNPNTTYITDAEWWLWCALHALEPASLLGGIYANKKGFHNTGNANLENWPDNYSIRDEPNRRGPWWRTKASALDWTFPDAQRGDYKTIDKYTSRLVASATNPNDPRLDLILYEFYGQADTDLAVEGYDELHDRSATSDSSHLWHIHKSFLRDKCGDFWGMWALYTVLIGWTVAQWRASLPATAPQPAPLAPKPALSGIPTVRNGSRQLSLKSPMMRGTDVLFVQKWIGPSRAGKADGIFGAHTKSGVVWYQRMRGLAADGIVGPRTWRAMGVR